MSHKLTFTDGRGEPAAIVAGEGATHDLRFAKGATLEINGVDITRKAEAQPYLERFGLRGAIWYAEGLSLDQAAQLHAKLADAKALESQLTGDATTHLRT